MRFHSSLDFFLPFYFPRCVQVGQFYHATDTSAAIAKIDWHPWGEAGSTLLVMTVNGKLRYVQLSLCSMTPFLITFQRI